MALLPLEPYDFTYLLIPQDDTLPFKEFSATAALCGDTLTELLKTTFGGGTLTNMDSLKAEYGAVVEEKMDAFQAAADQGTVQILALVKPSKTTLPQANTGTYLYFDEMGSLKERPLNRRAFELAKQCGLDVESPFPGDVYIGRVTTDQGPRSVSFALDQMESSSPWILQAPAENAEYANAMRGFNEVVKTKDGTKTKEEQEAEDLARGWRWTQTEDDIEVTITVPEGTKSSGLSVVIGAASLKVTLKSAGQAKPLCELKFFAAIRSDDSTWTIGKDEKGPHVQVTLEKMESVTWSRIDTKL